MADGEHDRGRCATSPNCPARRRRRSPSCCRSSSPRRQTPRAAAATRASTSHSRATSTTCCGGARVAPRLPAHGEPQLPRPQRRDLRGRHRSRVAQRELRRRRLLAAEQGTERHAQLLQERNHERALPRARWRAGAAPSRRGASEKRSVVGSAAGDVVPEERADQRVEPRQRRPRHLRQSLGGVPEQPRDGIHVQPGRHPQRARERVARGKGGGRAAGRRAAPDGGAHHRRDVASHPVHAAPACSERWARRPRCPSAISTRARRAATASSSRAC